MIILNNSKFFKVSHKQYIQACGKGNYDTIKLPRIATRFSAGYDFFLPSDITLGPGESIKIPTGIRCKIEPGWFLAIFPRSSLGFKYRLKIDNTVGIIDGDYFNTPNEGHIFVKMTNEGTKPLELHAGDAFCQGIFIPYGVCAGDLPEETRTGGFGSTNK